MRTHGFRCPACGEHGEIELPDTLTRFDCPGECGAGFLKYSGTVGWSIKCVVRPVFRSPQETASD